MIYATWSAGAFDEFFESRTHTTNIWSMIVGLQSFPGVLSLSGTPFNEPKYIFAAVAAL